MQHLYGSLFCYVIIIIYKGMKETNYCNCHYLSCNNDLVMILQIFYDTVTRELKYSIVTCNRLKSRSLLKKVAFNL